MREALLRLVKVIRSNQFCPAWPSAIPNRSADFPPRHDLERQACFDHFYVACNCRPGPGGPGVDRRMNKTSFEFGSLPGRGLGCVE